MKTKPNDVEASGIKVRCAFDELADPKELKAHPLNPNKHPPKQIELYQKIIEFQGWRRPITVSLRSGFVTRGHGALEMALQVGLGLVPVDYQQYDSDQEELADIAADNLLAQQSVMDTGKLQSLAVQIDTGTIDMELIGMPLAKIEQMFLATGAAPEIKLTGGEEAPSENSVTLPEEAGGEETPETSSEPESSHVRMVQLFLDESNIGEFMSLIEHFQEVYKTANVTDTVLEVLRKAKDASNL